MPDTSVARVALGASTLNRKWYLDVDTNPGGTASWVGVFGIQEFKPAVAPTVQDTSDFTSAWKSNQVTALAWTLEGKVKRSPTAASALSYDPGQEVLRLASVSMARVHIRWYEMSPSGPRVESYEGWGTVEWSEDGGGQDAPDTVTWKINGDGARTDLSPHPQPTLPSITSILPLAKSVGNNVVINGYNLTGATAGAFGTGHAFAAFTVISDTQIAVTIPTGATAVENVTVTTPLGTSAPFAYTIT